MIPSENELKSLTDAELDSLIATINRVREWKAEQEERNAIMKNILSVAKNQLAFHETMTRKTNKKSEMTKRGTLIEDDGDRIGYFAILEGERSALSPESSSEFRCILEDRETGNTYETSLHVAVEPYGDLFCLNTYFYYWHYCPCHRETDARVAGYKGEEKECNELEGKWRIVSVTCDGLPGVNLYFEDWK